MKKALIMLGILLILAAAFYAYTQSGTPIDEPAPTVTTPTTESQPEKPAPPPDTPLPEDPLEADTQQKINQMLQEGQQNRDSMSREEKMEMEEEMVMMMNPDMSTGQTDETGEAEEPTSAIDRFNQSLEMMAEAKELMDSEETAEQGQALMTEAEQMMNQAQQDLIAADQMMNEEGRREAGQSRVGFFTKIDAIHQGSGKAIIYPNTSEGPILRLEDFSVTRGPDLHVYLSRNAVVKSADDLGTYHDLGLLKSSKGNQNYQLPSNHEGFKSVVIWCQAFGVLFSSATLFP